MTRPLTPMAVAVAGMIVIVALAIAAVYGLSQAQLGQKVVVPADNVPIPSDLTAIQHGQHLASAVALCLDCHGANMAGKVDVDDPMQARIVAPNLTRGAGGLGGRRSPPDYLRAIRYGVDPTGRLLWLMPSDDYNRFGDADLGAIVAYLQSLPPVDSALPASEIRWRGRVMLAIGRLSLLPAVNIDPQAPRLRTPDTDVTPQFGQYVSVTAGCSRCHASGFALADWSEADFLRLMRTGRRPDGRAVNPSMPWPYYAQMTEIELRALWQFLRG